MTSTVSTGQPPFALDPGPLRDAVIRYASNPLYADNDSLLNGDNPYRRQLAPQSLSTLDFGTPVRRDQMFGRGSLAGQRMLTNIYEADLVFLPTGGLTERWEDFRAFYSPANRARGEIIRPDLERLCFSFLDDEVEVTGAWTAAALESYLTEVVRDDGDGAGVAEQAIAASTDPARAARMWMIQFAPDFLSEASPMIRNVLGNYGAAQSEWFKIVIDEYGYGVHETKHSTLFVDTMTSLDLDPGIHTYWQYYLAGSLALNNYFHYLGKNHEHFFRYLGALYYTECTLVGFCERVADMLTSTFEGADATYFTEHVHIDVHHGRMALEKLVLPLVERCGAVVIPEIVRGVEEFRELSAVADEDMAQQIAWMDGLAERAQEHDGLWPDVRDGRVRAEATPLVGTAGTVVTSDQYDEDTLLHVGSGTMRLVAGFDAVLVLGPGDGVVIPAGRLHGAIIDSGDCTYETYALPEGAACSS